MKVRAVPLVKEILAKNSEFLNSSSSKSECCGDGTQFELGFGSNFQR